MLQGTSATAPTGVGGAGQTRPPLVISPVSGRGLPPLPAPHLGAASSPHTAAGGGCAKGWPGKRVHGGTPAVQSRPRRAAQRNCSAQHRPAAQRSLRRATSALLAFPSRSAACTALSRAVTPNPSLQRTRQKRRAAELQYR